MIPKILLAALSLIFIALLILSTYRIKKQRHQQAEAEEACNKKDVNFYYCPNCLISFSDKRDGLCPECGCTELKKLDDEGRRILKSLSDGKLEFW